MDKEVVIHIHNGILLSYKKIKECTWVSSDEEDEPGAYYREWSKSERERQTLYINTYIWDLERQYQWFYVQGSKHRCKEQTFGLNGRRFSSVQFSSVAQSCPTLYNPMNCSTPGLPVHQQLPESTQTHVHWVSNAIQPSHPLCPLLLPSIFPSIRVFFNESALRIRWPKYWNFSFSISPSNGYSGLISFRMDWLDPLAVQGTLKSLLQHHSSKTSILRHSAFFIVQLSHPYVTTGKTIALTRRTFVGKGRRLRCGELRE